MLRILLLLLALSATMPHAAWAQATTAPAGVSPDQAKQLLNTVQDPQKREALVDNLQTLSKTAPQAGPLAPDSLGGQILNALEDWSNRVQQGVSHAGRTVADLPLLGRWLVQLAHNPEGRRLVLQADLALLVVLGGATLAFFALRRALRRPMRRLAEWGVEDAADRTETERPAPDPRLAASTPDAVIAGPVLPDAAEIAKQEAAVHHGKRLSAAWRLLRRLPSIVLHCLLDLLPVAAFALVGVALLGTGIGDRPTIRRVTMEMVNASALFLLVMVAARLLAAPDAPRLRLVRMSDEGACYLVRWVRRLAALTVFGVAIIQTSVQLGVPRAAQDDLLKMLMLVVHALLVVVVLQCRQSVARRIHARRGATGLWAGFLNRTASIWHWIAIFYIVASWGMWAIANDNGLAKLGHLIVVTVPVVLAARLIGILLLGGLYRALNGSTGPAANHPVLQARATHYVPLIRGGVTALLWALTVLALLQVWGLGVLGWFSRTGVGERLLHATGTVLVTVALAVVVWECANIALDRKITQLATAGQLARVARLRTLLPILQTSLLIAILVLVGLTVLSEIGVNIAPLLAGAGIVGVALGFGSQKLVQDLITGLFLLLENAMQVGDTVTLAGLTGVVEHLSIRTIRLRAGDGAVHIIPFSSVSTVTNVNRGQGNAAVSVTVAYDEDLDRVGETLKQIAAEMREDPAFKDAICQDFALWGVDQLQGTTATIVGQIVCTDAGRWGVQREFNRRIQRRFRELGIAMGVPGQMIRIGSDKPPRPVAQLADAPPQDGVTDQPPPSALGHDS